jgi:hypothetical protein
MKQYNLRLADDLHSWLVSRAAREHRSVNGHIEYLLEQDRAADRCFAGASPAVQGDSPSPGRLRDIPQGMRESTPEKLVARPGITRKTSRGRGTASPGIPSLKGGECQPLHSTEARDSGACATAPQESAP